MQACVNKKLLAICMLAMSLLLTGFRQPHALMEDAEHSKTATVKNGCKQIFKDDGFIPITGVVTGTGDNCLAQDLVQRNVLALDNGKNIGSPGYYGIARFFRAHELSFNLQGHIVSGMPFNDTVGVFARTPDEYNGSDLRVFNGVIINPGILSIGVYMGNLWLGGDGGGSPTGVMPYKEDGIPKIRVNSREFDSLPHTYTPPTRFSAEDLHIQSGGRGIIMVGSDNVVRNNVIEVDSKVAVYLYGPRPIIEGNTFIVRLSEKDTTTLPAILKLRDAYGAIIRNNKFIVKPDVLPWKTPGKAEAAINLLTSKNVLIENNTVMDTRQLLRKDESSTAEERGNVLQ